MKLYLTGGTGFVGSNIVKVALEHYQAEVFTTTHTWQPKTAVSFAHRRVELRDRKQVLESVRAVQPTAIIHAAALLDFPRLYQDRQLAWEVYVETTRHLSEAANDVGAKMILVSSDWVFDGSQTNATESTPPNPINYYGLLKVVGETVVAERAANGAVARVAGVNGMHWLRPDAPRTQNAGYGHFAAAVVETLTRQQPFTVWEGAVNMRATPSLASACAEMILRLVALDRQGVFHCCGGESIDRMDFARLTADVFDLDADLLKVGPPDPADPGSLTGYPVPQDTSLSAAHTAQQLAYQLPTVRQQLQTYRRQMETGKL